MKCEVSAMSQYMHDVYFVYTKCHKTHLYLLVWVKVSITPKKSMSWVI